MCASVCAGSGAGGPGSPGGAAAAAAAARAPALLAAQLRSARHFVRFTKILVGKKRPAAAAARRPASPPPPPSTPGPSPALGGPGTAVFAGEGLSPPRPRAPPAPPAGRDPEPARLRRGAGDAGGGERRPGRRWLRRPRRERGAAREPRLRLTGGSGASAPPSSRVIVLPLDSSLPSPTPSGCYET